MNRIQKMMMPCRILPPALISALFLTPSSCLALNCPDINRRRTVEQIAVVGSAGLLLPSTSQRVVAATGSPVKPISTLSDGTKFPLTSFGLQIYNDDMAYKLTLTALEVGYRNFFASVLAGNQKGR